MQQEGLEDAAWDLDFHVYGRDTKEIFIVGEALAPTQEMAASIASIARIATIVRRCFVERLYERYLLIRFTARYLSRSEGHFWQHGLGYLWEH